MIDALMLIAAVIVALRPTLDVFSRVNVVGTFGILDIVGVAVVALVIPAAIIGLVAIPRLKVLLIPAAFVAISAVWSIVVTTWQPPRDLVPTMFRVFGMAGAFLAFAHISSRRPRLVFPLLIGSAIVPFATAAWQIAHGVSNEAGQASIYVDESVQRLTGTFVHPSGFGLYAGFMLVLAFTGILLARSHVVRACWVVFAILSGGVVLLTFTRVVWIAAPVAIIAMALICRRPLIPLVMLSGAGIIGARLGEVQTRLSGFSSLEVRQRLWAELLPQIRAGDFLFGQGLGRVNAIVLFSTIQAGLPLLEQAHNDYLRVLLESGVVGLALYVGTFAGFLRAAWVALAQRNLSPLARRMVVALIGCTFALLIASVTDNLFQRASIIWTYWAIAGAAMQQMYLARAQPQDAETHAGSAGPT